MLQDVSYHQLARELLRQLRGHRPQRKLSRALGYRSNVLHTWESGRRFPRASEAMRLAARCGSDLPAALRRFYGEVRAPSAPAVDLASATGIAAFLRYLRGDVPIAALAARCGRTRSRVSRWLGGQTEPRLPEFLQLVEVASMRLVDWLATFSDPGRLPSVKPAWESLEAQRSMADVAPYSEAVLRALELAAYQSADGQPPGWIARRLGLPPAIEDETLAALVRANVISAHGRAYRPAEVNAVDLSPNQEAAWLLRRHWARVALERLGPHTDGRFSYNVFSVSAADFERLKRLQVEHFDRMRSIIEDSQPVERVAVTNLQIFALDDPPPPEQRSTISPTSA